MSHFRHLTRSVRPKGSTFLALATLCSLSFSTALAQTDYGRFEGYELRVKLTDGPHYGQLYAEISKWEEMTGANVKIISQKSLFNLDREIKQDIAAGTLDWCVGSNHTSFAPQYGDTYVDLRPLIGEETLNGFIPRLLEHSTVAGRLVQLPRHADISNLYYIKSIYADEDNKARFAKRYGYPLSPPETWDQVRDHARFFSNPPQYFGTQFVGREEALTGRFYEMLIAEGGALFNEDWTPAFDSAAGARALEFFVGLYRDGAVPVGTPNYNWGEVGAGFASGKVAINLDWGSWAASFNSPEFSRIAGDVGIVRAPKGRAGLRTGWSGAHSFSVTRSCENTDAAVSFIIFMTDAERQIIEARQGVLPSREEVWDKAIAEFTASDRPFMVEVFEIYRMSLREDAFTPPRIPEWIEVSNEIWPRLQAAILGDMSIEEALREASEAVGYVMEDAGYL